MASLATIVTTPLPQGGAIQTLHTTSRSVEIADNIQLCNTYNIDVWVYLAIVPSGAYAPTGALIYGDSLGPHERMVFEQRYMRPGTTIQGYANVGNAVQLACNILK